MSAVSHHETHDVWVCADCYFAHHYGATMVDREATDDELSDWTCGYLRTGHHLPNMVETDHGLMVREWFAGDSDTPSDREPLGLWRQNHELTDNTCSDHEVTYEPVVYADGETDPDADVAVPCPHCGSDDPDDGIMEFSWRQCSGCGSTLGGSRYRLAVWT